MSTTGPVTSRQRQVGAAAREETRRRLLDAAAKEFIANGYAAATVNRIARRAGVTVQTLYLAWGSKRELLRAYLESTLAGGAGPYPEQLVGRFHGRSPREVVELIAALVAEIAGRSADGWKLYRDAAATDPEIAEDWQQLQLRRRETFERVLAAIPDAELRLSRRAAVDTAWVIASPDTYDLLVRRAGYGLADFERWMAVTLAASLLPGEESGR